MSAHLWLACIAAIYLLVLAFTLYPYRGNVTALFHMDERLAQEHTLPAGFVVLGVPAYDGAQYYLIANRIPALFDATQWPSIAQTTPVSYAYQRILLPIAAFILSLGQTAVLPYTFLLINLLALLAAAALMLKHGYRHISVLAVALCPSAMIALHFSTAEPLTILLLIAFLVRRRKTEHADGWDALILLLAALSREVNIIFIGIAGLYYLYRRDWKSVALMCIPALVFIGWQLYLQNIFGDIPFLINNDNRTVPLSAPLALLFGTKGYNQFTLSSIALLLLFVIPATIVVIRNLLQKRHLTLISTLLLGFLALMLCMPIHIWGSITSIGRAITPVYPLWAVYAASKADRPTSFISIGVALLGIVSGLALAVIVHPFSLS